jgi:hypothetical protein
VTGPQPASPSSSQTVRLLPDHSNRGCVLALGAAFTLPVLLVSSIVLLRLASGFLGPDPEVAACRDYADNLDAWVASYLPASGDLQDMSVGGAATFASLKPDGHNLTDPHQAMADALRSVAAGQSEDTSELEAAEIWLTRMLEYTCRRGRSSP